MNVALPNGRARQRIVWLSIASTMKFVRLSTAKLATVPGMKGKQDWLHSNDHCRRSCSLCNWLTCMHVSNYYLLLCEILYIMCSLIFIMLSFTSNFIIPQTVCMCTFTYIDRVLVWKDVDNCSVRTLLLGLRAVVGWAIGEQLQRIQVSRIGKSPNWCPYLTRTLQFTSSYS